MPFCANLLSSEPTLEEEARARSLSESNWSDSTQGAEEKIMEITDPPMELSGGASMRAPRSLSLPAAA